MSRSLAALALALGLGLSSKAEAFAIPLGVEWDFEGSIHLDGHWNDCCQPTVWEGERVTGSFVFDSRYLQGGSVPSSAHATITLPNGTTFGYGDRANGVDGPPGSPDSVGVIALLFGNLGLYGLQPGWVVTADSAVSFLLYDADGVAWSGLNPRTRDVFPDDPPDLSLFEHAFVGLGAYVFSPPASQTTEDLQIYVSVDRWVPEPSSGALAGVGFAVLAALRSSARGTRRGGRAVSR